MVERVVERGKEPEPSQIIYEEVFRWFQQRKQEKLQGQVVIRGNDLAWEQARQGLLKHYLYPGVWEKVSVPGWFIVVEHIRKHSGRHRHQGGLGIYVLEGKGYTVVDGVKYDWEKDDLILLPVKPDGCEHQHFNAQEGKPCFWLAFSFSPYWDAMGNELEQRAVSPEWQGRVEMPHVA